MREAATAIVDNFSSTVPVPYVLPRPTLRALPATADGDQSLRTDRALPSLGVLGRGGSLKQTRSPSEDGMHREKCGTPYRGVAPLYGADQICSNPGEQILAQSR